MSSEEKILPKSPTMELITQPQLIKASITTANSKIHTSLQQQQQPSLSVSPPSSSSSSTSSISPSKRKQAPISCAFPANLLLPPPVLDVAENANNEKIDISYFDSFPPGYRFCPFDAELVVNYLKNKVTNQPLPRNMIVEVNLYRYNPDKLAEEYRPCGEKEWYFFTPRDKKYRNGTRPNRAAGDGYWKATGADKSIKHKGVVVGFRKALVFYKGKPPKGDKTNWIMHEYRVNNAPPPNKTSANDMRLDDWVLCRIYKKAEKSNIRVRHKDEEAVESNGTSTDHFVVGMDVDYNRDSPGYTNTFGDSFPPLDLPNTLPDITQFETATNYGNPYEYDSCMGIAQMSEPVFGKALQTMFSSDGIFTSRYLNDSLPDFKSKTCQEEWPYHANYGDINIVAAPQLDMVSLENIMPTNTHSNLSEQSPDLQSNSGWH